MSGVLGVDLVVGLMGRDSPVFAGSEHEFLVQLARRARDLGAAHGVKDVEVGLDCVRIKFEPATSAERLAVVHQQLSSFARKQDFYLSTDLRAIWGGPVLDFRVIGRQGQGARVGSASDAFGAAERLGALREQDTNWRGWRRGGRGRGSRFSPYIELETHEAANLLDGLVSVDLAQMDRRLGGVIAGDASHNFPILTGIQDGTVVYERADPMEHWQSWRELMEQKDQTGVALADCEDLSAAVAAELLFNGIEARTYTYQSGPRLYHVVVQTNRWGLLDPSRAAGMGGNG